MSTMWGYQCKHHEHACVLFARTGYIGEIKRLLLIWPQIKDARKIVGDFISVNIIFDPAQYSGEDSEQIWEFLEAHFDHKLLLANEYGDTEEIESHDSTN